MPYDAHFAHRVREQLAAWISRGVEFARTLPPQG
jgi:hypothetical protein